MDFESYLAAWKPFIEKTVGHYRTWAVPPEDLRQEATIVLWEIYERYGPDHPDILLIVGWSVHRRLKKFIQAWRTKELLIVDKPDWDEGDETTFGAMIPGSRDIDLPILPPVLTHREKEVVLLKGLLNYSWDDIAGQLGMSPNTARRHWTHSRVKLERLISGGTDEV